MPALISTPPDAPVLITVREVTRQFGIARSTVYQLVADGKLQARQHGNKWLILYDSVVAWANSLEAVYA